MVCSVFGLLIVIHDTSASFPSINILQRLILFIFEFLGTWVWKILNTYNKVILAAKIWEHVHLVRRISDAEFSITDYLFRTQWFIWVDHDSFSSYRRVIYSFKSLITLKQPTPHNRGRQIHLFIISIKHI